MSQVLVPDNDFLCAVTLKTPSAFGRLIPATGS